jgi:hypothetical protein
MRRRSAWPSRAQTKPASRHKPAAPIAAPAMRRSAPPSRPSPAHHQGAGEQEAGAAGHPRQFRPCARPCRKPHRRRQRHRQLRRHGAAHTPPARRAAARSRRSRVSSAGSMPSASIPAQEAPSAISTRKVGGSTTPCRCWRLHRPTPAGPAGGPSRQRVQQAGHQACFRHGPDGPRRQRRMPGSPARPATHRRIVFIHRSPPDR